MSGKVFIVGAGPGDPGLITVRGAELLRLADVAIYDRLANPLLLDTYLSPHAERVYVGKESSRHTLRQDAINDLLVRKAREGKTVLRLHGGDPFIFGRGGEEALTLASAGIPFEVVPGITSAIAAPAYAGIPVTLRGHNTSFAVVTGHEDAAKSRPTVDWASLACGAGTLVILMGMENLPVIVAALTSCGRDPSTPVALVRWGTWARQGTLVGTLGDIVEKVAEADFHPPAVIVVGSVVEMREKLRWWDNRPLSGKRVLVTRTRGQASALSELLREQGAEPVESPVIETVAPETWDDVDGAIRRLDSYDWVVFTSANAVRAFLGRLEPLGLDVRALGRSRLAAIGPATANELRDWRLKVDLVPDEYVAESAAAALAETGVAGKRVLLPRGDLAREVLGTELSRAGAEVEPVVCYRTVPASESLGRVTADLADGRIDVVTLTSSSTARYLVQGLGDKALDLLSRTLIACIGPVTAKTARELGLNVGVVSEENTIPALVDAVVKAVGGAA